MSLTVIENELVPVYETDEGIQVVNGRELHQVLKSGQDFSTWVKKRLNECDAEENKDYDLFHNSVEQLSGKKYRIDYIIKLDTAKEMAMLERNEKGKQVRKYFIDVEKRYKNNPVQLVDLSPQMQALSALVENMVRHELEQKKQARELAEVKDRIESIREVVAINTKTWRDDTSKIISKIGAQLGGNQSFGKVRNESYELLERRLGVSLRKRLLYKRRRMAEEGISKTAREKLTYVDIISEDKKLIEGYMAIVKEMAIKYGIA